MAQRTGKRPRERVRVRDRVHHTRRGAPAVPQRCRAAHHLNSLDRERIDRHGMIGTLAGNVLGRESVLGHFRAKRVLAPNHRTTRTRREPCRRNARLARQRLAEGGTEIVEDLLPVETVDGNRQFVSIVWDGIPGHHELFHVVAVVTVGMMGVALGRGFDARGGPRFVVGRVLCAGGANGTNDRAND